MSKEAALGEGSGDHATAAPGQLLLLDLVNCGCGCSGGVLCAPGHQGHHQGHQLFVDGLQGLHSLLLPGPTGNLWTINSPPAGLTGTVVEAKSTGV